MLLGVVEAEQILAFMSERDGIRCCYCMRCGFWQLWTIYCAVCPGAACGILRAETLLLCSAQQQLNVLCSIGTPVLSSNATMEIGEMLQPSHDVVLEKYDD